MNQYKEIFLNATWRQTTGLVVLLGMCPLLAVTTSVVNGIGLGLATTLVMALSNGVSSLIRNYVPNEIRIPVFILIIAVLVTIIQLTMNAYVQPLYLVLGIYVPLIVANCIVLGRVEAFASKNPFWPSLFDGFASGLGLTLTLALLGGVRELFGKGTLFSGIDLALGESAKAWVLTVIPNYPGFLLAILPPGAFIGLGFLVAGKKWLDECNARKEAAEKPGTVPQTA